MPPSDRPVRRVLVARFARVAGAFLVVGGVVLGYANRVVFRSDAFAARSADALADPRVSGFVAERIADEVTAQDRDLLAFRPLIVGAARTVVASEPFRALFRRAAATAHAAALSSGAETLYLSVPDLALLLHSALSRAQPEVAAKLPRAVQAQLGQDVERAVGSGALRFLQAANRLRRLTLAGLVLGALLMCAGVALEPNRRHGLKTSGLVLTVAALLMFLLPPALGVLLSARISEPGLRLAARGVWDAFADPLRAWALVLAAMGVVLSAAASSLASHVEVEEALRRIWHWLRKPARRPAVELARVLALMGVGVLATLSPGGILRLVTVVVGAALAFEGLRGLFALVAPRIEGERSHTPAEARGAGRPGLRRAILGLAVVGLLAAGIAWLRSPAAVPATAFVGRCNGSAALCDRTVDQVVFPAAHNAMAAADVPGWMFPNQEVGMAGQLGHGIRGLLFDVHNGVPVQGRVKTVLEDEPGSKAKFEQVIGAEGIAAAMRIRDRLVGPPEGPKAAYLCHGFCELGAQPLVAGLREIREFLVENPGEVLLIVIEDYVPPTGIERAFEESGLAPYLYRGRLGPPWPTLRSLVERGERVLVSAENDNGGGSIPWYGKAYDFMEETPYHFEKLEELSCRANRGGNDKSLFLMNHWIDTTPTPRPSNAAVLNQKSFLLARARQCAKERGRLPNILAVDFALTGDVVGAAAELNDTGEALRPTGATSAAVTSGRTMP
jgi:hypothetical protein